MICGPADVGDGDGDGVGDESAQAHFFP